MIGNKKSFSNSFGGNVMKNFGLKSFGGKNDLDFDGVVNKKDCQPRNTMRQDWNVTEAKQKVDGDYELRRTSPRSFLQRTMPRVTKEKTKTYPGEYGPFGRQLTSEEEGSFLKEYYDVDKEKMRPIRELKGLILSSKEQVGVPVIFKGGGHEGRHRAYAAELAGEQSMPVIAHKESFIGETWEDNDGDGIINAEDCEPNNPDKQGIIHDAINVVKGVIPKPKYMDWDKYKNRIGFMDKYHFQQKTRRQNIENIPPVGQYDEEGDEL